MKWSGHEAGSTSEWFSPAGVGTLSRLLLLIRTRKYQRNDRLKRHAIHDPARTVALYLQIILPAAVLHTGHEQALL